MATVMERRIRGRERQEIADELSRRVDGEVRFDPHSRLLYSTDASIYQMEPVGVVIPRSSSDVQAVVDFAVREGIPVLPRSGGTSLAGQTVNHAIVLDFSKYLNNVLEVNAEEQWARVQPGIILDQLTRQMGPHGLQYAPDPTTANRACVGGGIGNNTCGAHSVIYGKTLDHIQGTGRRPLRRFQRPLGPAVSRRAGIPPQLRRTGRRHLPGRPAHRPGAAGRD